MSWLGCAPVTEELPQLISQVLKSAIAILERMAARHESHYVPKADQAHAPPPPSAFSSANPTGVLRIHLREANGLRGVDLGGSSDPYVVVCAGELETRSEVIRKSRDPRFHQTIWLGPVPLEQLVAASKGELTVRVMDRNSLRADVLLGTARLVLGPLEGAPTVREYVVPLTREPSTSAAIVQPLPLGTAPPPPPAPPPPAATAVDGTISLAIDFVEVHPDAKGRLRPWPLYVCSAHDLDTFVTIAHDCRLAAIDNLNEELHNACSRRASLGPIHWDRRHPASSIRLKARPDLINVPYLVARMAVAVCKVPSFPTFIALMSETVARSLFKPGAKRTLVGGSLDLIELRELVPRIYARLAPRFLYPIEERVPRRKRRDSTQGTLKEAAAPAQATNSAAPELVGLSVRGRAVKTTQRNLYTEQDAPCGSTLSPVGLVAIDLANSFVTTEALRPLDMMWRRLLVVQLGCLVIVAVLPVTNRLLCDADVDVAFSRADFIQQHQVAYDTIMAMYLLLVCIGMVLATRWFLKRQARKIVRCLLVSIEQAICALFEHEKLTNFIRTLSDAVVDELCIDMGLVSGVLRGGYDAVGGSAFVLGKIEQRFYNRYRPKIIQIFDKLLKRGKYAPNAKSVAMVEPTDEAPAESPATEDAKVNESIKTLFTGLGVTHVQRKHAAKRVQRQARRLLQQRRAKAPHGVSA